MNVEKHNIILCTLNARYIHTSFGLRYLYANMGDLQEQTLLLEKTIHENTLSLVEELLEYNAKIIAFSIYIWNTEETLKVIEILKGAAPHIDIILGGPEVSYEIEDQNICTLADYIITGEGEVSFPKLCQRILTGLKPFEKVLKGEAPDLDSLKLPYQYYSDEDIKQRVIYVEASRGCPYKCEYCLSALDTSVRNFKLDTLLPEFKRLIDEGVRVFKFIDRTFNLKISTTKKILQFFLDNFHEGMFLQFEMVPDRLPVGLRDILVQFPKGALQFEIGLQTFNIDVCKHISRQQDFDKIDNNVTFLKEKTGIYTHIDLIAGLPGENWDSFAIGFNRLLEMAPNEIQVGILKRLRGSPIIRHSPAFQMQYSPKAPYEILRNQDLSFKQLARIRRFAKCFDLVHNSGNFTLLSKSLAECKNNAFEAYMGLSDMIFFKEGAMHSIRLDKLAEHLFDYIASKKTLSEEKLIEITLQDFCGGKSRPIPNFIKKHALLTDALKVRFKHIPIAKKKRHALERQDRHM